MTELNRHIFVTYARADTDRVAPIIKALREQGLDVWLDQEDIAGATFWRKEIVQAITACSIVVFFATKLSCRSEHVSKELALANDEKKPILPVLLDDVEPSAELRYQIAGLQKIAWFSNPALARQQISAALQRYVPRSNTPEYQVCLADVTKEPSDLLLLKHAQAFYGADKAVASALISSRLCQEKDLKLKPGDYAIIETKGLIAPARVMFLGTPGLSAFSYDEMQYFARRAVEVLAKLALPLNVVTTTVHGSGYGLDGGESLQRLIRGFEEGFSEAPSAIIRKIVFVTLGERAKRTLASVLADMNLPARTLTPTPKRIQDAAPQSSEPVKIDSGPESLHSESVEEPKQAGSAPDKKRVFVAMPYSDEFENVYEFGIYPAVRNCGFICEKVDKTHFTGDILFRIKQGIETASIVIADLTQARPNVYLEVGYAWGRGTRVIFLARKGEDLHFDVSTHRCLYYGKFTQLAEDLEQLLRGLEVSGEI